MLVVFGIQDQMSPYTKVLVRQWAIIFRVHLLTEADTVCYTTNTYNILCLVSTYIRMHGF